MKRVAVFAGTFDPFTIGHQDLVIRALSCCDNLFVAIGNNSAKKTLFPIESRVSQIQNIPMFKYELSNRVTVTSFSGLLVEHARAVKASIIIRGIRSVSDFEYEINLANINRELAPNIQTIFLPTKPELSMISSSMVKELAKLGAAISEYVPDVVAKEVYNVLNPPKEI